MHMSIIYSVHMPHPVSRPVPLTCTLYRHLVSAKILALCNNNMAYNKKHYLIIINIIPNNYLLAKLYLCILVHT